MRLDEDQFTRDVVAAVTQVLNESRAEHIDATQVQLECLQMTAEAAMAFESVPEATATTKIVKIELSTREVTRVPLGKAAREVAEAAAVGGLLTVIFPPAGGPALIGVAAGGVYAIVKKGLELIFKKGESLSARHGALLSALIALQYDPLVTRKKRDYYPTLEQVVQTANRSLKPSLRFENRTQAAEKLDELKRMGVVNEHEDDRWDLAEAVWVTAW